MKIIKKRTDKTRMNNSSKQTAAVFDMKRIMKKSEIESEKVIFELLIPNTFLCILL